MTPYEINVAWDRTSIKVCWGDKAHQSQTLALRDKFELLPYTTEQKKWIQDIVTQEFQQNEIGLEFVGWQNCKTPVDADIVLFRIEPDLPEGSGPHNETGGRATIGKRGQVVNVTDATTRSTKSSMESSTLPYLNYVVLNTRMQEDKKVSARDYLKLLALHEFGHSAGLRHAHIRLQEAKDDPNCKRLPDLKLKDEPTFSSTHFSGTYDHNSIMNYCFLNVLISRTGLNFRAKNQEQQIKLTDESLFTKTAINEKKQQYQVKIGLSRLDKSALRCLYKPESETNCNLPK